MRGNAARRMSPRTRADLFALSGYQPGEAAAGAVKLSSNESGFRPLPGVTEAARAAAAEVARYPDNDASELRAALAERWGATLDEVTVGPGSGVLCQELVQATCDPGQMVAFGWRSFDAYRLYARSAHASVLTVPNRPDGHLDLDGLASAVAKAGDRVGIVFLCSPNNPTGTAVSDAELDSFLSAVPEHLPVVMDEAYAEFATGVIPHAIDWYRSGRRNVVMLRTFSKAYGLAGLRVGYAIGDPELLSAVQAVRSPFGVTAAAQAAALAALSSPQEVARRAETVATERSRVLRMLRDLDIPAGASEANFVWLPLGDRSREFTESCRSDGVLVRCFPEEGVRVTVSVEPDNDRFIRAAGRWAKREER
jgi:histidinol-phosphate aminotransferase